MTITISADIVAWYAAIVSTTAVGIQLVNLWRDRPRIKVTAHLGYRAVGGPYDPDQDHIIITVSNAGRRPRTINKVGFTQRIGEKSQPMVAAESGLRGPQELTEGRSSMWLIRQGNVTADEIEEVWAYDQTDRKYSGKVTS